jgi:predicted PurR-regulated permease PerM
MKPQRPADVPALLTRERVLVIALALLTLGVGYACLLVVAPFVPALTWALTLAIVAEPVYARVRRWTERPTVAAGVAALVVTLAVALPLFYAGALMVQQALDTMGAVRAAIEDGSWMSAVSGHPTLAALARYVEAQFTDGGFRSEFAASLATGAKRAASRSVLIAIEALVTVFFLFYFLRDNARFLRAIPHLLPLSRDETGEVLDNVHAMIKAMVYGTLAVALLQGFLGGLAFWWLGLPAPVLWGGVMALLSILPMFGAALVWAPVALYLAITGDAGPALALTLWGALVVGLVDNVLKPLLVKGLVHVHTVPVFVAVLGGLFAFGGSGVLLGPIILAVAIGLLDVWRRRFDAGGSVEEGVDRA